MHLKKQQKKTIDLQNRIRLRTETPEGGYDTFQPEPEGKVLLEIVEKMSDEVRENGLPGGLLSPRYPKVVRKLAQKVLEGENLTEEQKESFDMLIQELLIDLGPLKAMLEASCQFICVRGCEQITYEDQGVLKRWGDRFLDETHVKVIIAWLVGLTGQQAGSDYLAFQGTVEGLGWFSAMLPPMAKYGPQLEIFTSTQVINGADALISAGFMDRTVYEFLKMSVSLGLNILVMGEARSGKTTLMQVMGDVLNVEDGLIVTIGQSEMIHQRHLGIKWIQSVTERKSHQMFKQIIKLHPKAILFDDDMDGGIIDFLYAAGELSHGCIGSLECRELSLLHTSLQMHAYVPGGNSRLSETGIRHMLNNLDLIIQVNQYTDHVRRISRISQRVNHDVGIIDQFHEKDENMISIQDEVFFRDIFVWNQVEGDGKYVPTGYIPKDIINYAKTTGIDFDVSQFRGSGRYSSIGTAANARRLK